jgi:hypothetical protein
MLKIHIIKKIDNDINILNTINSDIDILIINKIVLATTINFRNKTNNEIYIENIFKNVNLPMTLKHLIIEEFELNEVLLDIEETFLTDIFFNLKLPLNCVIDAKYTEQNNDCVKYGFVNKYVRFYSSLNNKEEKFEICKNNIPLMNRNEKFYNEYYKYIDKIRKYKYNKRRI